MKTFKQYLKEAKDNGSWEESGQISFESLNGGLEISIAHSIPKMMYINPFIASNMKMSTYINSDDYTYDDAVKNFKPIYKEIKNIMDDFDNKILKLMKKYGYKRL